MKPNLKQVSKVSGLLVAFSLVPVGNNLLASEKKPAFVQKGYPENFANIYIKDCVSVVQNHKSTANMLKPEQIRELCSCTLNQFQTKYKYSEFQALSKEQKEKEGYACVGQLMFK